MASSLLSANTAEGYMLMEHSELLRPKFEEIVKDATKLMSMRVCDKNTLGFTAYVDTNGKLTAVCNKKHDWNILAYPGWAGPDPDRFIYRPQVDPNNTKKLHEYNTPANITSDNTTLLVRLGEDMYKVLTIVIRKRAKDAEDKSDTPYINVHIDIDKSKLPKPDERNCYYIHTEPGTAVVTINTGGYWGQGPMGSFPNIKYRFCPAKERLSW